MSEIFLDATMREVHGKSAVRKLRRTGRIPAVIYGLNDPLSIELDTLQTSKLVTLLHGGERMVALRFGSGNGGEKHVLLREVQTTPTGNRLLHIDFQEIDTNKAVHVTVEVRAIGTANGVKLGGVLQAVKHDVVVECLPNAIPAFIEVDVEALEIGDSIHVKDISFMEGVVPVTDAEETIIVVSAPRVEEEVEEEIEGEEGAEGEEAATDGEKEEGTSGESEAGKE
jgi:large subunit ribosomal protein L25